MRPIKRTVIHSELRQSLNSIRSSINLGANHYILHALLSRSTAISGPSRASRMSFG